MQDKGTVLIHHRSSVICDCGLSATELFWSLLPVSEIDYHATSRLHCPSTSFLAVI